MPRKPKAPAIQRRGAAPGTLTSAQILHLLVGDHRYRYKGFRLPAAPFKSEAERRQLWEQNKDLLRSYCKQPISDDVRRELLIPDRIKAWTIAAVPAAEREYSDPGGMQTQTPPPTPDAAQTGGGHDYLPTRPEAPDGAGGRP